MIQLAQVWKEVQIGKEKLAILQDISLEIKTGEFVAVVGPSGSGKSTLMHVLGLLDKPTQGTVTFDGKDIVSLSDSELSRLRNESIGFVFQQFNLLNKLSVLENIVLPVQYSKKKSRAATIHLAHKIAERFGISHRLTSYPNKISGGEQQRVAMARALIMEPELILADEPTGNLDTKSGNAILSLLKELHTRDKKTVILVTHEADIAKRAKRKITIIDGQLAQ